MTPRGLLHFTRFFSSEERSHPRFKNGKWKISSARLPNNHSQSVLVGLRWSQFLSILARITSGTSTTLLGWPGVESYSWVYIYVCTSLLNLQTIHLLHKWTLDSMLLKLDHKMTENLIQQFHVEVEQECFYICI